MKNKYNLAFWGAGNMASVMVDTVDKLDKLNKYAVASRTMEKSASFAKSHNISHILTYDELLVETDIDLVYISTPTKYHYSHIKQCLLAGKNVICEKPMVETELEASELFELAKNKNLLLIDGLWTMYMPIVNQLKKTVSEIGVIKFASAELGWPSIEKIDNSIHSIYELWDYEIYPLSIMHSLFGMPQGITSKTKRSLDTNIENNSILKYKGFNCRVFSSLKRRGTYCLIIIGTKGIVICRKYWLGRYPIFVWKYPFSIKKIKMNHQYSGYEYELDETVKSLDLGNIQSSIFPHQRTIELMKSKEHLNV